MAESQENVVMSALTPPYHEVDSQMDNPEVRSTSAGFKQRIALLIMAGAGLLAGCGPSSPKPASVADAQTSSASEATGTVRQTALGNHQNIEPWSNTQIADHQPCQNVPKKDLVTCRKLNAQVKQPDFFNNPTSPFGKDDGSDGFELPGKREK